jgi:hypothetical protein
MPAQPLFLSPIEISSTPTSAFAENDFGVVLPEGFRFERQDRTKWCWAAISSFVSIAWSGVSRSQLSIATALGQDGGNNSIPLPRGLRIVLSENDSQILTTTNISRIEEEYSFINKALSQYQCPVPLAIDWDFSNEFHFICLFAVNRNFSLYYIYDPWSDHPDDDLYVARPLVFLNSYIADGGSGRATYIYKWIP